MENRLFCGYCQTYRDVKVYWVKFYTDSNQIDTAYTCNFCHTPQIKEEGPPKTAKIVQMTFDFKTPA